MKESCRDLHSLIIKASFKACLADASHMRFEKATINVRCVNAKSGIYDFSTSTHVFKGLGNIGCRGRGTAMKDPTCTFSSIESKEKTNNSLRDFHLIVRGQTLNINCGTILNPNNALSQTMI